MTDGLAGEGLVRITQQGRFAGHGDVLEELEQVGRLGAEVRLDVGQLALLVMIEHRC